MTVRTSSCRCRSSAHPDSAQTLLAAAVMAALAAALPGQVATGLQFAELEKRHLPQGADTTSAIATGDIDSDGDLDLVTGNYGQNHLLTNLQHQLDAPYALRPGFLYTLEAYSRYGPPSAFDVALPYLSATRISVPLLPLGIIGIDPVAALPPVLIPRPAGLGIVTWNVPSVPGVAGIPIYAQALLVQWPLEVRLTNTTTDVILP